MPTEQPNLPGSTTLGSQNAQNNNLPNQQAVDTQTTAKAPLVPPSQQKAQMPANVKSPKYSKHVELLALITSNMVASSSGEEQTRLLIAGDTGLGKTSFISQLGRMLGMGTMIIEVPHLVEENLINIPYTVVDKDGAKHHGNTQVAKEGSKYKLVQAEASLVTEIDKLIKVPDNQYDAHIKSLGFYEKGLLSEFEKEYGLERLYQAREMWDRILFIDEYFRTTTKTIRTLLRGILNGQIGNDPIPPKTFPIYASNLSDQSGAIEEPESYHAFGIINFDAPSLENWLYYTVAEGVGKNVHFKEQVINAFVKNMKDEHISINDVIRTSPRRWSEILFYLNNMFPFKKGSDDANIAYSHVRAQFENQSRTLSGGFEVFHNILKDLAIASGVAPSFKQLSAGRWRDVLNNVIVNAIQIGPSKKYVPVIQGEPGIGKTAIVAKLEADQYEGDGTGFNLRTAVVNCTTIHPDDMLGIPSGKDIEFKDTTKRVTEFSEPLLYNKINKLLIEATKNYKNQLIKRAEAGKLQGRSAEQVFEEWENQKYKFAILFDEINRVKDIRVFNSLRKLILTKEFDGKFKLDPGTVVIGSMNPGDSQTMELTDHFRDAIEIIHSEADWNAFIGYMRNNRFIKTEKLKYTPISYALNIGKNFIEGLPKASFITRDIKGEKEFHWSSGGGIDIRVDPRALDHMYRDLVANTDLAIKSMERKGIFEPENLESIKSDLTEKAVNSCRGILTKKFMDIGASSISPNFLSAFTSYMSDIVNESISMKTTKETDLESILDEFVTGKTKSLANVEMHGYMSKFDPAQFNVDFERYLEKLYKKSGGDFDEFSNDVLNILNSVKEGTQKLKWSYEALNQFYRPIEVMLESILESEYSDLDKNPHDAKLAAVGKFWNEVLSATGAGA